MNYSNYSFRINTIYEDTGLTWLFLPGGPGLGSEYLEPLCRQLKLPGSTLLVDFPKDGTNKEGRLDFDFWKRGLIDLVSQYERPILVSHSFSGMFVLDTPELEPHLTGLVLMNTTTRNSFFAQVSAMQEKHLLPDLLPAAAEYHLNPCKETYKQFWHSYKYYCFTAKELSLGEAMITSFAFNNEAYHYAIEHFFPNYQCRWHPKIPTLTIAGEDDYICPPTIFTADPLFQQSNILNKIIHQAGHCSWLLHLKQLQTSLDDFIKRL
ncbi:alpha/beta fold hydrolase [Legionella sp. km772]|uniref:alpha/beta fold hydrolase n=1 Tax=Legionella sp. km772 TaxID=2498111 RepID=UPI000F8C5141|nr:alpha/beta hydrolase [Legionella sp. km772]RUR11369.1 alpha/beta hydrolase [Legionella sp. km772]